MFSRLREKLVHELFGVGMLAPTRGGEPFVDGLEHLLALFDRDPSVCVHWTNVYFDGRPIRQVYALVHDDMTVLNVRPKSSHAGTLAHYERLAHVRSVGRAPVRHPRWCPKLSEHHLKHHFGVTRRVAPERRVT